MCGIAGFSRASGAPDDTSSLKRMTDSIVHRGPDGEGAWIGKGVHLGHRRLTIIDVSTGDQPMVGESGCVITYNGEIYNYLELRRELEAENATFRTTSDTEVLLKLYERDGEKCLDRLIGMFAFAIWDPNRKKLFLARDRLGKKPLYVFEADGFFAFASEIKALLTLEEVRDSSEIDLEAVKDFLSLGYILTPKTIFRRIKKLPAGHYTWYEPGNGMATPVEYWDLSAAFMAPKFANGSDTQERFKALFDDAVRLRLRSDVPLGGFLSGGLDSVSVVASMASESASPVSAYCIGFDEPSFDESAYAKAAARHLKVDLTVSNQPPFSETDLRNLIWHADEPFADTSIVPTYSLNKIARRGVKVALSGDGADEILAGYPTYRADAYHKVWSRMPPPIRAGIGWAAEKLVPATHHKVGWDHKLRKFLAGHAYPAERAHYFWREIFTPDEIEEILSPDAVAAVGEYDPFDRFQDYSRQVEEASFLDRTLYVDTKTWLQDDILVKVDRMSMANSLEVRTPFLDHRLVEFCARLPAEAKLTLRRQKGILRDVMSTALPAQTLNRGKQGFNTPTQHLGFFELNGNAMSEVFKDTFKLNKDAADISFRSFSLAVLSNWMRMYDGYRKGSVWHA